MPANDQPQAQQEDPICATEARFILTTPVKLRLREKIFSFSGEDFKIGCVNSNVDYFKCLGRAFSIREKKTLRDSAGVPILNFKEGLMSYMDKFDIYAGDHSDRKICQFHTKSTFIKTKMWTDFEDVVTGKMRHVVLKGGWSNKRPVIYLGEPKEGGIPIAKINRPLTRKSLLSGQDEYFLEIPPGVDIALIVTMCIALDEHKRD